MPQNAPWEYDRPVDASAAPWERDKPIGDTKATSPASAAQLGSQGLSGLNEGFIANTAGAPVDLVEGVVNFATQPRQVTPEQEQERRNRTAVPGAGQVKLALDAVDAVLSPVRSLGLPRMEGSFGGSESIKAGMRRIGSITPEPEPEQRGQRFARSIGRNVGEGLGVLVPFGAAGRVKAVTDAAKTGNIPANIAKGVATRPVTAAGLETGAGATAGIGGELADPTGTQPGRRALGEIGGGILGPGAAMAPLKAAVAVSPTTYMARAAASAYPPLARRRAREVAKKSLSEQITPETINEAQRTGAVADEMGLDLTLAERTGSSALQATQRRIESQATGADLDRFAQRYGQNEAAIQRFAETRGPRAKEGPDTIERALVRAQERAEKTVDQMIARQTRRGEGLASRLFAGDEARAASGRDMRSAVIEARGAKQAEMSELAKKLGLNDDVELPFERAAQTLVDEFDTKRLFDKASSKPKILDELEGFLGRAAEQSGQKTDADDLLDSVRHYRRAATPRNSKSLAQHVLEGGGLRDEGGEITNMLGGTTKTRPGLLNNRGQQIDDAIVSAVEQGYFPGANLDQGILPTQREFLDALAGDLAGRKVFSQADIGDEAARADLRNLDEQFNRLGVDPKAPHAELVKQVEEATGTKLTEARITFDDWQSLSQRLNDDAREALGAATPDYQKARTLNRMRERVDQLGDEVFAAADPKLLENYRLFKDRYRKEFAEIYRQGPLYETTKRTPRGDFLTADEAVASRFFAPNSITAARKFKTAVGEKRASELLEVPVFGDLAASVVDGGVVSPRKLNAWRSRHREILKEFPSIAARVEDVGATASEIQKTSGLLAARRKEIGETILAKKARALHGGARSIEEIVSDAMKRPQTMAALRKSVANDPAAREALKRHVWDGLASAKPDDILAYLNEHKASIRQVLGNSHIADLEKIARAREVVSRVGAPSGRAGMPNDLKALEETIGVGLPQIASRIFAVKSGRTSARYIGVELLQRLAYATNTREIRRIEAMALYDPDVARDLRILFYAPGATSGKRAAVRLRGYLIQDGDVPPEEQPERTDANGLSRPN